MSDDLDDEQELDAALAHHEAGRLDRAEAGYRAILRRTPDELDALNLLAVILQDRGALAESIELLTRALTIEPAFPEALTNLSRAQCAAGNPADAAEAARSAVAQDPTLAEAHLQLGRALLDLGDSQAAADALTQAVALSPDSALAHHQLGMARLRLKNYRVAADDLRSALRLDPGRVDSMVCLGAALAGLEEFQAALLCHQQAVADAPDDASAHAALAVTLRHCLDATGSIAACRRTLELAPDRKDILLLLGANLASAGQFAEAETCYRKVLTLDPTSAEARRDLAMINRQSGDALEIGRLRATLDDPASPRTEKTAAGYGLGTLLDRAGDYDAAFDAFDIANRLARENLPANGLGLDARGLRTYVDWAITAFRSEGFAVTADWGDTSERPVFIVGMPRSGTSLVEQIVASHSKVFGAGERRDLGEIARQLLGDDPPRPPLAWDRAAVRQAAVAQVARLRVLDGDADRVVDKMPDNILLLGAIAVLLPGARIIVCRRDLRDVCLSCYVKPFTSDMVWTLDLAAAAARAQQIERLMDHWRAVLPLRMIEVEYETLVGDLEGQSRRLIDFLGLEWEPACLAFHKTERPVLTASVWEVRQALYTRSVGRWRHYRKHLGPLFLGLAGLITAVTDEDWDAAAADPVAALATAMSYHQAGRLDVAEPIYRALLRRDPDDSKTLHLQGLLLVDRGDLAQSIALISRSLALQPNTPTALADLARAQCAANAAEEAAASARKAIALDPTLTDAHVQLGTALMMALDFTAAADVLRHAAAQDPGSVEARVALAAALTKGQDAHGAVEARRSALALRPNDSELIVDLAASLCDLDRFTEALALFRRALVTVPNHPRAQCSIAQVLLRTNDAVGGIAVCEQALAAMPDRADLWLMLANCQSAMGRFDDAADAYRHALAIDPDSAVAMSGLAEIGRQLTEYVPREAPNAMLWDESKPVRQRVSAGFAVGRVTDRTGQYDAAFEAYARANRLLRQDRIANGYVFERGAQHDIVDWLIATIGPDLFVQTQGIGDPSTVPVFVVGLPRSGTTLVEQIAASHGQVFGAGEGKWINTILGTLNRQHAMGSPVDWDRAVVSRETTAHVAALASLGGGAVRVIDKLPGNIMWLGQLAILFPCARFVVCRRDLRDVCLSCFFQYFEQDTLVWTDDLADCGAFARETERLMSHWRRVLPVPILEIQYESLVANLESESRRLIAFLGLDWDPACLAFHETKRAVLTASHWQVRQPLYTSSVGRWRHYEKHLEPLLSELYRPA
jgi:tetratricopeptide (TPR) repeat protein